jgi:hypothetical protein
VDKDYRQYIIGNLKDPVVKAFWVHEFEAWKEQFRNEAIAPIQNNPNTAVIADPPKKNGQKLGPPCHITFSFSFNTLLSSFI